MKYDLPKELNQIDGGLGVGCETFLSSHPWGQIHLDNPLNLTYIIIVKSVPQFEQHILNINNVWQML
jgi:hypothetical protein